MASRVVTQESFIAVQIAPQIQKQLRRACLALAVGKCLQLPRQVAQFREESDCLVAPQPPFRSFQNCSERVEPSRCCSVYRAQGRPQMPEAHRNMKPVEQSLGGSIVEISVTQHILAAIGNDRQCGTIPNAFLAEKSVYAPSGKTDRPSAKTKAHAAPLLPYQDSTRATDPTCPLSCT